MLLIICNLDLTIGIFAAPKEVVSKPTYMQDEEDPRLSTYVCM